MAELVTVQIYIERELGNELHGIEMKVSGTLYKNRTVELLHPNHGGLTPVLSMYDDYAIELWPHEQDRAKAAILNHDPKAQQKASAAEGGVVKARVRKGDGCMITFKISSFEEIQTDMGFKIEGIPGDKLTKVTTANKLSVSIDGVKGRHTVLESGTELDIEKLDLDLAQALLEALDEKNCIED